MKHVQSSPPQGSPRKTATRMLRRFRLSTENRRLGTRCSLQSTSRVVPGSVFHSHLQPFECPPVEHTHREYGGRFWVPYLTLSWVSKCVGRPGVYDKIVCWIEGFGVIIFTPVSSETPSESDQTKSTRSRGGRIPKMSGVVKHGQSFGFQP